MAAIRAKLSLLQRIAENYTWEEFSRACAEEKQNLGVINVKEVKIRNVKIDLYSQQLIPADELTEFVLLETLGDGSCFFRSISKQIYGDESLHEELRLIAIVELALKRVLLSLMRNYVTELGHKSGHFVETGLTRWIPLC